MNQNFLWICISTQLCSSLLQCFRKFCWAVSVELCWQSVSVVSFILVKFLISKRGITPRERKKISYGYAHLHIMSFITINFHEILLRGLKGVVLTNCLSSIFHFVQISKLKKRPKATPICNLVLRIFQTKQEAHGPHRSPEKTVQINKHIWLYHNVD